MLIRSSLSQSPPHSNSLFLFHFWKKKNASPVYRSRYRLRYRSTFLYTYPQIIHNMIFSLMSELSWVSSLGENELDIKIVRDPFLITCQLCYIFLLSNTCMKTALCCMDLSPKLIGTWLGNKWKMLLWSNFILNYKHEASYHLQRTKFH